MKKIAFVNDIHLDEDLPVENGVKPQQNWNRILDDISTRNITEIVVGGDIGGKNAYPWFFSSLNKWTSSLKLLIGNHDDRQEVLKYYKNPLANGHAELYYASDDDFIRYIYLDSSAAYIGPAQFSWFLNQLNTTRQIVLFIHHPVLSVDTAVDRLYPLHNRQQVKDALLQCPGKVSIFCAHYHMAHTQTLHNITQYITPAVSYQLKKQAPQIEVDTSSYAYRTITITGAGISTEVIVLSNLN